MPAAVDGDADDDGGIGLHDFVWPTLELSAAATIVATAATAAAAVAAAVQRAIQSTVFCRRLNALGFLCL